MQHLHTYGGNMRRLVYILAYVVTCEHGHIVTNKQTGLLRARERKKKEEKKEEKKTYII